MDQSLSGGSGNPSRMTLTVICSFRESSNMRENYTMRRSQFDAYTEATTIGICGSPALSPSNDSVF